MSTVKHTHDDDGAAIAQNAGLFSLLFQIACAPSTQLIITTMIVPQGRKEREKGTG
jgi:hypothetical protein